MFLLSPIHNFPKYLLTNSQLNIVLIKIDVPGILPIDMVMRIQQLAQEFGVSVPSGLGAVVVEGGRPVFNLTAIGQPPGLRSFLGAFRSELGSYSVRAGVGLREDNMVF